MWIITAWQDVSPELSEKSFKLFFLGHWMRLMMVCCGIVVKRMERLGVSVRKKKTLTMKTQTMIH